MITSWQLYWLTRFDYILGISIAASLIFSCISIGFILHGWIVLDNLNWSWGRENPEFYKKKSQLSFKRGFVLIIPSIIFIIFSSSIPTTKEMATILVLPKIINNQKVQQLPDKVLNLANEWIDELSPKKEKKEN